MALGERTGTVTRRHVRKRQNNRLTHGLPPKEMRRSMRIVLDKLRKPRVGMTCNRSNMAAVADPF